MTRFASALVVACLIPMATLGGGLADVGEVTATVEPRSAAPGEAVTVRFTIRPNPGCYTYPTSGVPAPTVINFGETGPLELSGEITDPPGYEELPDDPLGPTRHYTRPVTWVISARVKADAKPGKQVLSFAGSRLQICNDRGCTPVQRKDYPKPEIEVVSPKPGAAVAPAVVAAPPARPAEVVPPAPAKSAKSATGGASPPESIDAYRAQIDTLIAALAGQKPATIAAASLAGLLAAAVFWGFVSLATPCVFPMIPITISLFLKQSNQSTGAMVRLAAVYSLTIVVVLGSAAAFLLATFQALSVHEWMNLFLGALFVFFATSLLGLFEVSLPRVLMLLVGFLWVYVGYHVAKSQSILPESYGGGRSLYIVLPLLSLLSYLLVTGRVTRLESSLLQSTERGRKAGGVVGTVAGALAFSLVSFTCVAPFLGGFAGVLESGGFGKGELMLAGFAFAAAFASPFFLLALFPGLVKKLPRSGGWLDTVKAVMGFLELAAALKFFRTAELRVAGKAEFFTYDLCLAAWVVIALTCGLYLLNRFRLPHDAEETNQVGVWRLVLALSFLTLGVYLAPGLAGRRPAGGVYAWVNAFLLPEPKATGVADARELPWSPDLVDALDQARAAAPGLPNRVFVDFTGVTCSNCKLNEDNVFPRPEITQALKKYRLVQLYTDTVEPGLYKSPPSAEVLSAMGEENLRFQDTVFQNIQRPLYVILEPQPGGAVRVVDTYGEGKINDAAGFEAFLTRGLAK